MLQRQLFAEWRLAAESVGGARRSQIALESQQRLRGAIVPLKHGVRHRNEHQTFHEKHLLDLFDAFSVMEF